MLSRPAARLIVPLCLIALGALSGEKAIATDVVMVEEHWELTVGGPEFEKSCPQVSLVMSPYPDLNCDYFVFTINHATFPNFVAGGLQLQRWHEDDVMEVDDAPDQGVLHHDNEVISWKQRMWLADGMLKMKVFEGTSQTWGEFGGWYELRIANPTSLSRLNDYRPAVSINESGITYAGNRVSSLVLKKLIWKTADDAYFELNAPIDIDTDIDP